MTQPLRCHDRESNHFWFHGALPSLDFGTAAAIARARFANLSAARQGPVWGEDLIERCCLTTHWYHWGTLWKVQQLERNFGCFLQVLLDLYLLTGFTYLHLFYHDFTRRWQGCSLPTRWWDNESEKMLLHRWHIQAIDQQKCHADYGKICSIRVTTDIWPLWKIYIIW